MNDELPRPDAAPTPVVSPAPTTLSGHWSAIAWWKKMALGAASVLVVLGLGVRGVETVMLPEAGEKSQLSTNPGPRDNPNIKGTFLPGDHPGTDIRNFPRDEPGTSGTEVRNLEDDEGLPISPAMIQGGLSFIVGFSVGFALRTFLKMSLFVAGVVFLAIFGLSYAGFVEVRWDAMEESFNRLVASVEGEVTEFQSFITGTLPSAGLAGLGLFSGFRKSR